MRTAAVGAALAGAVLLLSAPRPAQAQTARSAGERETGALAGQVVAPSGQPLSGASVANVSSGDEARTGSRGHFRFSPLARGFHLLLVSHPRFGADTVRAPVTDGKTVFLDLRFREPGHLEKSLGLGEEDATEDRSPADADTASGTARIVGRLVDRRSDRPVEAATLLLEGRSLRATTDDEGRFALDSLPGGSHRLRVQHVGYGPRELVVDVPAGKTAEVRIGLAPDAVPMPPIEVETEVRSEGLARTGFYRRRQKGRKIGAGHFLVADEIVERGIDLSQVLASIPNLRSSGRTTVNGDPVRGLVYFPRYDEGRFGVCLPAIYLDDHKIVGSGSPEKAERALGPSGVSSLAAPSQVTGIEVYDSPASTMGRYQGSDSRCGVIAIWTGTG